jgi:hypothetical protein
VAVIGIGEIVTMAGAAATPLVEMAVRIAVGAAAAEELDIPAAFSAGRAAGVAAAWILVTRTGIEAAAAGIAGSTRIAGRP